MGFYGNVSPAYTAMQSQKHVTMKAPKKIEVFVHDFCEYCGKWRNVSLIPMQHGWAWYCLWCQLRYLWRTRGHRKDIYTRVSHARQEGG